MNHANRTALLALQPDETVTIWEPCLWNGPTDCVDTMSLSEHKAVIDTFLKLPYQPGETFTLTVGFSFSSKPPRIHERQFTCLTVRPVERDGWGFEMEIQRQ